MADDVRGDPIVTIVYTDGGRATLGHRATGDRFWPIAQDRRRTWDRVGRRR